MSTLKISGLAEARSDLRRLAGQLDQLVAPALTAALRPMADRARDLCPVRTGRTRDAITVVANTPRAGHCSSAVALPLESGVHRDLGTHDLAGAHELERAAAAGEAQAVAHVLARVAQALGR